jgi:sugar phosphate isomerase/epimerase
MTGPRLYLAIDNCFASKRWVAPDEWARLIRDLGLVYVEASADNDCDPFHLPPASLSDWIARVQRAEQERGVRVANLYSGHGTYVTLGLTHPDARVRAHFRDDWLKPMTRIAAELNAGLGFYCHAFSEAVLASPARHAETEQTLVDDLTELARYSAEVGAVAISLEQMRSPFLPPWTIAGSLALLQRVHAQAQAPVYLTVDVTHASAQQRCLRPTREQLAEWLAQARTGEAPAGMWLGAEPAYASFRELVAGHETPQSGAARLDARLRDYPYMFALPEDGDPYAWLAALGGYSPIIHLGQTTGHDAAKSPFTAAHNATGIIAPQRVLEALSRAYSQPALAGLPPRCSEIYLTLEIFPPTADTPPQIVQDLIESVAYWRALIPQDGRTLGEQLA